LDWGAQGEVYNTSKPDYLLKVCKPEDVDTPDQIKAIKWDSVKRYRTFSQLRFAVDVEVACLPLEYIEVDYDGPTPGYLMRRANGKVMDRNIKALLTLSLRDRYRIALSLAKALSFLHARQVVHADFKPDNFFYDETGLVQILDIDGGGYFGNMPQTSRFWPTVTPIEVYKAPELVRWTWATIWKQRNLRTQPDLWSLAVLLYQILVEINGPFPTKSATDDPSYLWFRAGDYARDHPEWPRNWQNAAMKRVKLDSDIIQLFEAVFKTTKRMQVDNPNRPDAFLWKATLENVLAKSAPQPVPGIIPRTRPSLTRVASPPPPRVVTAAKASIWEQIKNWITGC
jgi:serine/threonine protein kinase